MLSTASDTSVFTGTLTDGSDWEVRMPTAWNGYLVVQPDLWDTPLDAGIEAWLSERGFASARHSRDLRMWDVRRGLDNQLELLGLFRDRHGEPERGVIVWGGSMGGLLTRLYIEKHPGRYVGAIPMDGGGSGTLSAFNRGLDMSYVVALLLDASDDPIASLTGKDAEADWLLAAVEAAAATNTGRARLALAAAIGYCPVWSDPSLPRPDSTDPWHEAEHLIRGLQVSLPNAHRFRLQLEEVVGGTFVSNDGVDYGRVLQTSRSITRVQALYDRAGLSLSGDLATLAAGPRVHADLRAKAQIDQEISVKGDVTCPVIVLKSLGDPDAVPVDEHGYYASTQEAGKGELVRFAFVDTPGHLNFTVAERAAVFDALLERIESGAWTGSTAPSALNRRGEELAAETSIDFAAAFVQAADDVPQFRPHALTRFVDFDPPINARRDRRA